MALTLYNRRGKAIAYVDSDNESIYLYVGRPAGYLHRDGIYSYGGRFLGWFRDGWIIDRYGRRAFFTAAATGGPVKPVKQVRPVRGVRGVRPVKGVKQVRPVKPVTSLSWSDKSDESFFGS